MILVDTSVWIDFLRYDNDKLRQLLINNKIVTHQLVIGELACGNIKNRLVF
ncbi:MAG: PIN domain-containing protein [Ignavibacteriaceae bacterium]|nr:PIN domain-containing protein [Ignavibacteriaceae bacterium]